MRKKTQKDELEESEEDYLSLDGWRAHLNGFHAGLECGITSVHGALALEIDYSLQSFRGLLAILLQVMEERSSAGG